jgi:hypothetical protein
MSSSYLKRGLETILADSTIDIDKRLRAADLLVAIYHKRVNKRKSLQSDPKPARKAPDLTGLLVGNGPRTTEKKQD